MRERHAHVCQYSHPPVCLSVREESGMSECMHWHSLSKDLGNLGAMSRDRGCVIPMHAIWQSDIMPQSSAGETGPSPGGSVPVPRK